MHFYWVYDYDNWVLFSGLILLLAVITVGGIFTIRPWTDKFLGITHEDNGVVSEYMGVTGVFFGLVLGMIAVGAWEAFGNAHMATETEASQMGKFYRSVELLPEAQAEPLKEQVRLYAVAVIKEEWPAQQRGEVSLVGDEIMSRIGRLIYALPAETGREQISAGAAAERYFELVEARRHRIEAAARTHLPGSLWWVVIVSTFITISLSMLMRLPNRKLDIALNLMMSLLIGSILAFIIAMDHPFRGPFSVKTEAYELVCNRLMSGECE